MGILRNPFQPRTYKANIGKGLADLTLPVHHRTNGQMKPLANIP